MRSKSLGEAAQHTDEPASKITPYRPGFITGCQREDFSDMITDVHFSIWTMYVQNYLSNTLKARYTEGSMKRAQLNRMKRVT